MKLTPCAALLRGINVGRAKRIAMADLRSLIEGLGFTDVRTLLNSGNVVFQASRPNVVRVASAVEAAIHGKFGFSAAVVVVTAQELDVIVAENRRTEHARDPSKFLVAFVASTATLAKARPLCERSWAPDAIDIGTKAAYLWCANGIIESKLMQSFARATAESATTRNWATVLKLQAAIGESRKT